jgi:hypothetical protein
MGFEFGYIGSNCLGMWPVSKRTYPALTPIRSSHASQVSAKVKRKSTDGAPAMPEAGREWTRVVWA